MQDPSTQMEDQFERQYFEYVVDATVAASAVQQNAQLTIGADADFEWWWNKASRTSALLKLLLIEQATQRGFVGQTVQSGVSFNGINIDNWAGTAQAAAAFPLAVPYVMPSTRTYTILLTDASAAPNVVQLCFCGFKLWPRPSGQ